MRDRLSTASTYLVEMVVGVPLHPQHLLEDNTNTSHKGTIDLQGTVTNPLIDGILEWDTRWNLVIVGNVVRKGYSR